MERRLTPASNPAWFGHQPKPRLDLVRIVVAHQGSPSSPAAALVACHAWPLDSTVRVVTVIEPLGDALPTFPRPAEILERSEDLRIRAELDQRRVVRGLQKRGLRADGAIVFSRPVQALADAARRFQADLLILGPLVYGPTDAPDLAVAERLIDVAPCPVLVARRPSISRIVVGTDGSPGAMTAERLVIGLSAAPRLPVVVVSVAETRHLVAARVLPALGAFDDAAIDIRKARHLEFAEAAAARLRSLGADATAEGRVGDVATELATVVAEWRADLVVLGSDEHRGLSRIVLGSVARDTIGRTDASVLVARSGPHATAALARGPGRWPSDTPAPDHTFPTTSR